MDNPANTTQVQLNGFNLTLAPVAGTSWSYGGAIVDGSATGGSLVQNGPGVSILTGTSTYSGTTTVNAGVLEVNGAISNSSGVAVNSGGTLAGGGTVDPATVTINSGGTLAPGIPGTPGTSLTIAGNLALQSGAIYLVQVNSSASTFATVSGTASLGGSAIAAFAPGSYVAEHYTILQAAGLTGTFASFSTIGLPANFVSNLSYTNTSVALNLTAALGAGTPLNVNQQNVANALNATFNNGGSLPPGFLALYGLSGGTLANSLTQLDGEIAVGAEYAAFQQTNQFLNLMLDPFVSGRGLAGPSGQAIGFAPEEQRNLSPETALAYASIFTKAAAPASFVQRWTAWGAVYGGGNTTNGVSSVGSSNVTTNTFGFVGGMDYHYSPNTVVGFSLAGGNTNWGLVGNTGNGRSDAFQSGVYGITREGPAYLAAALSFTNNWFTTNRSALGDSLTANFSGQSYGARVESGYRFAPLPTTWAAFGVTPYAALQAQDFQTPSYSESDLTGGGFGLSYASMNATDVRTELGARFDDPTLLGGKPLILRARVAWAHDFVDNPSLSATFESLPGTSFIVNGAPIPHDSALVSTSAELFLTPNWTMLAKFDGEFANGSQTYAGTGTLRYFW
jgi:autotransporter-associated beta strand protein